MTRRSHFFDLALGALALFPVWTMCAQDVASRLDQTPFRSTEPGLRDDVLASRADLTNSAPSGATSKVSTPRFRVTAAVNGYYTTNAALTKTRREHDCYTESEIAIRYGDNIGSALTYQLLLSQALYRYDSLRFLEFESFNARAGLSYEADHLWNLTLFARYNFERSTEDDFEKEFLKRHTFTAGAEKTFSWDAVAAYFGYSSVFGLTEPKSSQRNEHGMYLGVTWDISRALSADVYYRAAIFDYPDGRRDLYQKATATLSLNVTKSIALNTSISFTNETSNRRSFGYEAWETGLGVEMRVRF